MAPNPEGRDPIITSVSPRKRGDERKKKKE